MELRKMGVLSHFCPIFVPFSSTTSTHNPQPIQSFSSKSEGRCQRGSLVVDQRSHTAWATPRLLTHQSSNLQTCFSLAGRRLRAMGDCYATISVHVLLCLLETVISPRRLRCSPAHAAPPPLLREQNPGQSNGKCYSVIWNRVLLFPYK